MSWITSHESRVNTGEEVELFFPRRSIALRISLPPGLAPVTPWPAGFPKTLGLPNQDANGKKFLNNNILPNGGGGKW